MASTRFGQKPRRPPFIEDSTEPGAQRGDGLAVRSVTVALRGGCLSPGRGRGRAVSEKELEALG